MGTINWPRVFFGGLIAGAVGLVVQYLTTLILAQTMNEIFAVAQVKLLTATTYVEWVVLNILAGVFIVWLYAVMRTHFGQGPKTALITGFYLWLIGVPLMGAAMAVLGVMPPFTLTAHVTINVAVLIADLLAALAGGWAYRDKPAGKPKVVAAAA